MPAHTNYDVAVIGGGINGCGIARDAAGRGLKVLLAEKDDLASGTSSASTKLIHGGLRYLETYEFQMVREALSEREVLMASAPHIIFPLRFILPHNNGMRPAWFIRLGLFLYDHLGTRGKLPASRMINLRKDRAGTPLQQKFTLAFSYADCWVDDARLVVANAVDAHNRGAEVLTRWSAVRASRHGAYWELELKSSTTGEIITRRARVLVNAAGPWAADVLTNVVGLTPHAKLRHVKGSHIVVPKLFETDDAYIFQSTDGRIIFAIPYEKQFTLIGTTDVDYEGDLDTVQIAEDETRYLCETASAYFAHAIVPSDVVHAYSGVRPLYFEPGKSAQQTTRDFVIETHGEGDEALLISVFGGKITTYRRLAEKVLGFIARVFPEADRPWTKNAPLPGGDVPVGGIAAVERDLANQCPAVGPDVRARLARTYGTQATKIFANANTLEDLGVHFGGGLYEREVVHLIADEWARTEEDILWRRTKLGLHLNSDEKKRLRSWLAKHNPSG